MLTEPDEYTKQTSERFSRYKEMVSKAKGQDTSEADATMLPLELREAMGASKAERLMKTREYFSKFTDHWRRVELDDQWKDMIEINRFLMTHHDMFAAKGKEDDTPLVFYYAQVPSILLKLIRMGFDHSFMHQNYKMESLVNYGLEILTTFFHKTSPCFMLYPEKFFRGPPGPIDDMVRILNYRFSFVNTLSAVRFFGHASFTPPCMFYFEKNPGIFRTVVSYISDSVHTTDTVTSTGQVTWKNMRIVSLLMGFRTDGDLITTAKLIGTYTMYHAIFAFVNVMVKSKPDTELFYKMLQMVKESRVIRDFSFIVKNLMKWMAPGEHINNFLMATRYYLNMGGAFNELFFKDFTYCEENGIEKGIESIRLHTHKSLYPSRLSWFLVHALCLSEEFAHGYALHILCYVFQNLPQEKGDVFVEIAGNELMDLAHLIDCTSPSNCMVQATLLEGLLRYAGFSHKLYNFEDSYEGTLKPQKEIPECCMEAALYCRRSYVEDRMPIEARQRNVVLADELKHLGNAAFKEGNYEAAIEKYTEAIALCPLSAQIKQAVYYSNRAECHLKTGCPMKAVHDCNRSLCLDNSAKVKVQWRRSRAYKQLGMLYPAWLDMKCIEKDWNLTKEQSGVDFPQLFKTVSDDLGVFSPDLFSTLEKRVWKPCPYVVPP